MDVNGLTVTVKLSETDFVIALIDVLKKTVELITDPEKKQIALENIKEWEAKYPPV